MLNPKPQRPWTVYVIHHSHTDIGYTEHQKKIERYHRQFIQQVLDIVAEVKSGRKPEWKDFRWTCECFWPVERYLSRASETQRADFAQAVKDGFIGLSGTYLHHTELVDIDLLQQSIGHSVDYACSIGIPLDSAMSADVNGFGWGYAQALADHGIKNLITCVHSHKGLAPTGRRQNAFRWQTAQGKEVLVWNGEMYNQANIFGLVPGGVGTNGFQDELYPYHGLLDTLALAEKRLARYLCQLEADAYPYAFVPLMASGLFTDNSPPSVNVLEFAQKWNALHACHIRIELVTVGDFFQKVRPHLEGIPTYRGDWPDWWTDGVGSQPQSTSLFRSAQRQLKQLKNAQALLNFPLDTARLEAAEYHLTLYGEHTFGHSESITNPWHLQVTSQSGHKVAHAQAAFDAVVELWDDAQETLGESPMRAGRPLRYKVINPTSHTIMGTVEMFLEHTDFGIINAQGDAQIIDLASGQTVPHQKVAMLRGTGFHVRVQLAPGDSRIFEVQPAPVTLSSLGGDFIDGIRDDVSCSVSSGIRLDGSSLETPFLRLEWKLGQGITSWLDKTSGMELLRSDRDHDAFTPVYEKNPVAEIGNEKQLWQSRRALGRNRKSKDVIRSSGELQAVRLIQSGPLYTILELDYRLPGTSVYRVQLWVWQDQPQVEARVQIHKDSIWESENLYISLPFCPGSFSGCELLLSKAGNLIRPWHDQIPGSLTDYYCVQEGFCLHTAATNVVLTTPDTPLLQLGPLEHGVRRLQGHPDLFQQKMLPYSWVMNNIWETNFNVDLGGFYEFRYGITWATQGEALHALQKAESMFEGLRSFRTA
jgi:hypothetical protein